MAPGIGLEIDFMSDLEPELGTRNQFDPIIRHAPDSGFRVASARRTAWRGRVRLRRGSGGRRRACAREGGGRELRPAPRHAKSRHRCWAARSDSAGSADRVVLGADTAVVLDDAILGKPRDDDERARHAAASLGPHARGADRRQRTREATRESHVVETTTVTLASLTDAEIDWYVSTGEGRDKAEPMRFKDLRRGFVERIDGSYTNVVGLPIAAVYAILGRYLSRKSL